MWQLGGNNAEVIIKFQSDMAFLPPNLAASKLSEICGKTPYCLVKKGPVEQRDIGRPNNERSLWTRGSVIQMMNSVDCYINVK